MIGDAVHATLPYLASGYVSFPVNGCMLIEQRRNGL